MPDGPADFTITVTGRGFEPADIALIHRKIAELVADPLGQTTCTLRIQRPSAAPGPR